MFNILVTDDEQIVIDSLSFIINKNFADETKVFTALSGTEAIEIVMKENIDMAFVTDKMAMSHSTFYRKVKALTGMTATEYIRKRRLRHCYELLESGDYNVNQAAMMTGFNQMAHFRETFKTEFGILPSEVKKK